MKKRKWIIFGCVIGILVILAGVFTSMFNLQHINVEVLKNPEIISKYGENINNGIIESGKFNYGSNTLFTSYDENKDKIEKAYPFVKVEKMVRRFPDKMTIYITGRMPEVIVKDEEKINTYYVLDIDMKVLAVLSSASDFNNDLYRDLPILRGSYITNIESGDFVKIEKDKKVITSILDGIYAKDQTKSSVMSDISIDLERERYSITLKDANVSGATIEINGEKNLKEKVFAAYSIYKSVENDSKYPDKNKMVFIVGSDFSLDNVQSKVVMKYDGVEV